MAPENPHQKPKGNISFEDELDDDFLTSWKPSKAVLDLDFEDDEPAPKNRKSSYSLGKMDTNFDFDFDGGFSVLSKFNLDMPDLDIPSSKDKSIPTKDSSLKKQIHDEAKKNESKFSFQFNEFDDLDLDDTLKTKKKLGNLLKSEQGKRESSSFSSGSKSYKKHLHLDPVSDDGSESTSILRAETTTNKEQSYWNDCAPEKGKLIHGSSFSGEENSTHDLHPIGQGKNQKESRDSDSSTDDCALEKGEHINGLTFSGEENSTHDLHPIGEGKNQKESRDSDSDTPPCSMRDSCVDVSTIYPVQDLQVIPPESMHTDTDVACMSTDANNCSKNYSKEDTSKDSEEMVYTAISTEPIKTSSVPIEPCKDSDKNHEREETEIDELNVESSGRSCEIKETDVSTTEYQRKAVKTGEDSLNEVCTRLNTMASSLSNEDLNVEASHGPTNIGKDGHQKSTYDLDLRLEVPGDGNCIIEPNTAPKENMCKEKAPVVLQHNNSEIPVGLSRIQHESQEGDFGISSLIPNEQSGLPSKHPPMKMPIKRDRSKISGTEHKHAEVPKSAPSKYHKDDHTSAREKHQDLEMNHYSKRPSSKLFPVKHQDLEMNHYSKRPSSKLFPVKLSEVFMPCQKKTNPPLLQSSRLLLKSSEDKSSHQRLISVVDGKSPADLQASVLQKKPISLRGSNILSLSKLQLNRSLHQGNKGPLTEQQVEGRKLNRSLNLALLSKTKGAESLRNREGCKRILKPDTGTSNGFPVPSSSPTNTTKSLKRIEDSNEKQPPEDHDTEMEDMKSAGTPKKSYGNKEPLQPNIPEYPTTSNVLDVATISKEFSEERSETNVNFSDQSMTFGLDDAIDAKSEFYSDRLDQLLKTLKLKFEEAMDLRVRAMVINNSYLMLNNPVDEEKIRKITEYMQEKLSVDIQKPAVSSI
ncbi:hypothetical protein KP509_23G019000 [Ceratopteris richardii]|uniref:Uncharacterized protein n=1 Tax=Ceratopteris richardii TaxID=49495 RepID=A0A8T2RZK8_CERRI|nr:hypothetical protein KP509_23G019000 [Ceratopteris richardii]